MGWNPNGSGPFSIHKLYGPASASAGSSVTGGYVSCFGAKSVNFIVRSDTAGIASIAAANMRGYGATATEANAYNTHGVFRGLNISATKNTNLGWVFSVLPCNLAGTSSDSAFPRRMWLDSMSIDLTVSTSTLQNLTIFAAVEWED